MLPAWFDPGTGTVTLTGELDTHSSIGLDDWLQALPMPVRILDLTGVTFISSAGWRRIQALRERDCSIEASRPVERFLSLVDAILDPCSGSRIGRSPARPDTVPSHHSDRTYAYKTHRPTTPPSNYAPDA